MKALLLKDWYVLRKQAWAYLIIVLVWGAIPSEVLNLLAVVYGAMIPYTAMAYDQRSRWDRFARMLPYSDRTVVLSRYALGWVSLLIGTAAVTLCQGIVSCLPVRTEAAAGLSPALIYTALCVGTILLSINVPLTLRFGSEKARMVSVLITFLVFASVGFLKGLNAGSPAGAAAFPALLLPAALTIIATAVSIPPVPEILPGKPLKIRQKSRPAQPDGFFLSILFAGIPGVAQSPFQAGVPLLLPVIGRHGADGGVITHDDQQLSGPGQRRIQHPPHHKAGGRGHGRQHHAAVLAALSLVDRLGIGQVDLAEHFHAVRCFPAVKVQRQPFAPGVDLRDAAYVAVEHSGTHGAVSPSARPHRSRSGSA